MAIDRIAQRIMADAEAEVKRIGAETDQKIEALRAETAETIAGIEQKAQDDGAKEAREQKRRIISRAQAEMRKELLEEKQKLIDRAFQQALKSLVELDEDRYAALMKKLLLESVETGDEEVILTPQSRGRSWAEVLSEVNRELSARGLKGQLTLSKENRTMAGGFVLRRGKKEINCALELIVGSLREELESEVARALFSEASSPVLYPFEFEGA
ncbi:MAG: V-type ATP synthase subunit E [bacterium]